MAAPADAGTLRGGSSGAVRVVVETTPDGGATRVVFQYRARFNTGTFRDRIYVEPQGEKAFGSAGGYTIRQRGGIRARVRVKSDGQHRSPFRWDGRFAASAVVRQRGRVIARCRLRTTRWAATAPQARITMTSDAGDYIGQGQSYVWATPDAPVTVTGGRRMIQAAAGGFDFEFVPAPRNTLRPGVYSGATRYPFNDNNPGLSVSGNGRGCNMLTGTFTINSIAFSRGGRLTKLDMSFEQHCEGGDAALRGTITFER